jgi:hypothetical protein
LALDQVKDTAALVILVVKERALFQIDGHRAVTAKPEFFR